MSKAKEASLKAYPHYTAENITEVTNARHFFVKGYEQAEKDLGWHSVKDSLPPMDEEVIVLSDKFNGKYVPGACRISYGHIVDKRYCIDYDGWNIPGVHHWMFCPKLNGKPVGLITKDDYE